MDRYILNQVAILVKFYRTPPAFYMLSSATSSDYKVQIEEAVLRVCKCKINPAVIVSHAKMLETTTAKYPYKKTEVKMYNIAKGVRNNSLENMFSGTRPNRIYVAFVDSLAVAGDYTKNPFNFQHYKIVHIALTSDGTPVSNSPLKLNFDATADTTVPAFVNLFDNNGKWLFDSGNNINKERFYKRWIRCILF
ncbi:hypothetical protein FSP39_021406 [Pinctada imbricata]|uniref:Uncharacterized protein n=1 Tax=Pinctada imbricata TaxID=66713 RepID=A0AA88YUE7_PINIB|nr:hypothetical protein FSP39_021406 [Pinctada imbricata]